MTQRSSPLARAKPKARPRKKKAGKSKLEELLFDALLDAGLGEGLEREFLFHSRRKWRADFAYPRHRLLIEVEGGTWVGGRHTSGAGYEKDCEKYNAAVLEHWRVLRFTGGMIKRKQALPAIRSALGLPG